MEHQDFNTVVFGKKLNNNKNSNEISKKNSQKRVETNENETVKIEIDKKMGKSLGSLLSQGRLAKGFKTQGDFVKEINQKTNLNISVQVYSKWESNKEIPNNEQIAKMEKVLCIKLPRTKKIITN